MSITYNVSLDVNAPQFQQNFGAFNVTNALPSTVGIFVVSLTPGTVAVAIDTAQARNLGLCFARAQHTGFATTFSLGRLDGTTLYPVVTLRGGDAALLRLSPGDYGVVGNTPEARAVLQILEQ
jgi:hypothetical protein